MTEQETIDLLTGLIQTREPFVHVRFGDGDVFFATGAGPKLTADGEEWSQDLADRLLGAWYQLALHDGLLLVGDVETYMQSDGCEVEWRGLVRDAEFVRHKPLDFVHMEALRASVGAAIPFYLAAARDDRAKVFVGPERLAPAAAMLGADHIPIPLGTSNDPEQVGGVVSRLSRPGRRGWEVAFFAAGRGGKIMQGALSALKPGLTQVDIGSGLDILFTDLRRGTDRNANPEHLRNAYKQAGLLVS